MTVEPETDRTAALPVGPSFDDWIAARGASLLRFGYVVTGSQHAAEDAVQDALARACEKWARVVRTEDPDSYVRRMIVNAHIVTGEVVWEVCGSLPPRQRAAVVLRFYEDLEYGEIAAILGCTEATARSHVHRALGALRERLAGADR